MAKKIQLLLADDHQIILDGLMLLIKQMPDVEVLAAVPSGREVMNVLSRQRCDIAVLDIHMPGMDGLETTSWIKANYPDIQVLILTMEQDPSLLQRVLDAGASGCVLKYAAGAELLQAIRQVSIGEAYISKGLISADVSLPASSAHSNGSPANAPPHSSPEKNPFADFTKRELEILQLVAQGYSSQEIADKIFISPATVDTHRRNMLKKAGAKNAATLISMGLKHRLI